MSCRHYYDQRDTTASGWRLLQKCIEAANIPGPSPLPPKVSPAQLQDHSTCEGHAVRKNGGSPAPTDAHLSPLGLSLLLLLLSAWLPPLHCSAAAVALPLLDQPASAAARLRPSAPDGPGLSAHCDVDVA